MIKNINLHDAILIDIDFCSLYKGTIKIVVESYLDQINDKNRSKIELLFSSIKKIDISLDIKELLENKSAGNIDIIKKSNISYLIVLYGGYIIVETNDLEIKGHRGQGFTFNSFLL